MMSWLFSHFLAQAVGEVCWVLEIRGFRFWVWGLGLRVSGLGLRAVHVVAFASESLLASPRARK